MTETTAPPPVDGIDSRRLTRNDDRVVGGVCAALARYTNVDPVIYRVSLAVLTIFGGLGVALYVLGWLLIPEEGEPESAAERFFHKHRDSRTWWIVGIVVVTLIVFGWLDDGHGAFPALVIGGLIFYLVRRERGQIPIVRAVTEAPPGWTPPPEQDWKQWQKDWQENWERDWQAKWQQKSADGWQPPQKLRRPKRERSKLGLVTLSLAVMVTGFLVALRNADVDGLSAERILGAAVLVLAGGLLVGTLYGRARWLIAIAVPLSLAIVPVSLVNVPITGGTGNRTWVTAASADEVFHLGMGEATLVLSGSNTAPRSVDASVGIGHLIVLVPDDIRLELVAQADMGEVRVFGATEDGSHVGYPEETLVYGDPSGPTVRVNARVGIGQVEVRHA